MHPSEFLKVAENLCDCGGRANLRTSVSRSYYASFLTARDYAKKVMKKRIIGKSIDHSNVKKYLASDPDFEIRKLANVLLSLQDYRKRADYEMDDTKPEDQTIVGHIFNRAEAFVKIIQDKTRQALP